MKRRSFVLLLVLVAVALALAMPVAAIVTKGSVTSNRGAKGVRLGMTRAQVIEKLGKPVFKNANGYMQYGSDKLGIAFDVYLDTSAKPARVRLIGINGAGFCLVGGGPCLMEKGGVGKLNARYGSALETVMLEDGEEVVWLKGTFRGCPVFTDFGEANRKPSTRIGMVFIGFQSGTAC